MSYEDQIINSDCTYCYNNCKCMKRQQDQQWCCSGWYTLCPILITDYDSVQKENNDFCCTCFCTLICLTPKLACICPFIPFICYNSLRNRCMKTENNNYIC